MHKVIQLISNFLHNKSMPLLCQYVMCSLDEFDEKPNHTKCQNLEILKERAPTREKTHFFNHLTKNLCLMGSKCLALCVGHMCKK